MGGSVSILSDFGFALTFISLFEPPHDATPGRLERWRGISYECVVLDVQAHAAGSAIWQIDSASGWTAVWRRPARLLLADNTTFESLTEPPLMPTVVSPRRRAYG
jgi:hypothetical protein